MKPFQRRRRNRRDMIVLGGWLFADLLLGLAMLFLVANTVGAPPPTPTPTATPDELATAEASFSAAQAANNATREALESDIALLQQTSAAEGAAATQTAQARATEAALSDAELATRAARATDEALAARATIAAFATEAASSDTDQAQLSSELATISAQATAVSQQVSQQATEQARIAAVATENASSGANTQATIAALETSNSTNADALATSQARRATLEQQQADLQATATAFADSAVSGGLSPNSVQEVVQVDLNGVISGDDDAITDAQETIRETFAPYADAEGCKAGFVLTSSRAPTLGPGVELSRAMNELLVNTVPEVFGDTQSEAIALPGTDPAGEVQLEIFFFSGCPLADGTET